MDLMAEKSDRQNFLNVLTSGYKEEVLKELLDNPEYLFTVNEITGEVNGSYNSVKNFLRDLEKFNIVKFQRKGNSYLIQYNQDSRYHEVIKTLLRADNQPLEQAAEKYAEKFYTDSGLKDHIRSIVLFGSVARGTAGPNSDIDILVLTEENVDEEKIEQKARNYAQQTGTEFEIVPVVENSREFRNNLVHSKRFETNVEKDGILLEGEELELEN